jgi:hypothetical protein
MDKNSAGASSIPSINDIFSREHYPAIRDHEWHHMILQAYDSMFVNSSPHHYGYVTIISLNNYTITSMFVLCTGSPFLSHEDFFSSDFMGKQKPTKK